jgi:S1-C subfamily serine protease
MDSSRRRFLGALGAATAGALAGCAGLSAPRRGRATGSGAVGPSGPAASTAPPLDVDDETPADEAAYRRVYDATIPSVVLVRTYDRSGGRGQGSGFVVRAEGETGRAFLVTNQHVVDGARQVTVEFRDGSYHEARVVGTDVYSDLAVLSTPSRPASARPLGLVEGEPGVGTPVVALGAPFGFGESVSAGIVSGQNRSLPSANEFTVADAVQTDAAVNPGNSGGPLVTLAGLVVGVVTAGGGDNLGFAVSAALVARVVPALIATGSYDHPYLGIRLIDVTPPIARANDLPSANGVFVAETIDGSPSDGVLRGGSRSGTAFGQSVPVGGDVIVALDDVPTPTTAALGSFLATEAAPGQTIAATVLRDGERVVERVTLDVRPEP